MRQTFEHKIADYEVELHVGVGEDIRRARTDSTGRAQFVEAPEYQLRREQLFGALEGRETSWTAARSVD